MKTKYENNFLELLFLSKWVQWLFRKKKKWKLWKKIVGILVEKSTLLLVIVFIFYFQKFVFGEYKEKTIFLYF